jgi:hypothetical protein
VSDFAFISFLKHQLLAAGLSVGERLRMLEAIDGCAIGPLTPQAIAVIEPANEVFAAIVVEAIRHAAGSEDGAPCFDVLERPAVFADLVRLNPSLRQAVALCWRR